MRRHRSVVPAVPDAATPAAPDAMRDAILAWFEAEGRPLAFRATTDPWAILVSEAMAQQTQAARAAERWSTFLAAYPTAAAFAATTPAAALRAWRGLGYNRRALNLRRAARVIVEEHGGRVPNDLEALRRLPGVGPYTARAVAALAFGQPVGALDTNVRRVLSRAVGGALDAFGAADLQAVADASVPAKWPGRWTHALMDVGATFCRPRVPRCAACPARAWCVAAGQGVAGGARSAGSRPRARTAPEGRFPSTTRWLRGRILDRLLDADGAAWVRLDGPIGDHGADSIAAALAGLAADGMVERHPSDTRRARLPEA